MAIASSAEARSSTGPSPIPPPGRSTSPHRIRTSRTTPCRQTARSTVSPEPPISTGVPSRRATSRWAIRRSRTGPSANCEGSMTSPSSSVAASIALICPGTSRRSTSTCTRSTRSRCPTSRKMIWTTSPRRAGEWPGRRAIIARSPNTTSGERRCRDTSRPSRSSTPAWDASSTPWTQASTGTIPSSCSGATTAGTWARSCTGGNSRCGRKPRTTS